jgi:hypothetical protein
MTMATREDYLKGKLFEVVSDDVDFLRGSRLRPFLSKDDGTDSPGFVNADHTGSVLYHHWNYVPFKDLKVVGDALPESKPGANSEKLSELLRDVQTALDTLPDFNLHFQLLMLDAIADECRRVATLMRKG